MNADNVIEQIHKCEHCGTEIHHNFWAGQAAGIALRCGKCGKWQRVNVIFPGEEIEQPAPKRGKRTPATTA